MGNQAVTTTQYIVVNGTGSQTSSYVWRFWQKTHSFYALARHPALSSVKVSLHGPHGPHAGSQFKVERDRGAADTAAQAGGVVFGSSVPGGVAGRVVAPGLRHVVTLRWTAGLFRPGLPTGLALADPAGDAARVRLDPPPAGKLLDVRLYVSDARPPTAFAEPGWVPLFPAPLGNSAGQYLSIGYTLARVSEAALTPGRAIHHRIARQTESGRCVRLSTARLFGSLRN